MKTKVYLAGGMNQTNWQGKVIKAVGKKGFLFYNPREHALSDSKQYTFWDLFYVRQCDILFAYMQDINPSGIGLTLEIGYAKALSKSIILVDEKSKKDKIFANKFMIVRESASLVFEDFNEAVTFLKKMKNGIIML